MKENFDLSKQLEALYAKHSDRRELVERQYCALKNEFQVNVIYIYDYQNDEDDFTNLIFSVANQNYQNINLFIASNHKDLTNIKSLEEHGIKYKILKYNTSKYKEIGLILEEIQNQLPCSSDQLFMITNRYEEFFYDHISSLVRCFEENINCQIVESSNILFSQENNYGIHIANSKEPYILDHNSIVGNLMFKSFPPSFILRYLDYRNYTQSLKSFFKNTHIKLTKVTIRLDINKIKLQDNSLCSSLTIDYASPSQYQPGNLIISKNTAYQILSHVKFLKPFLKIRKFFIKRKSKQ